MKDGSCKNYLKNGFLKLLSSIVLIGDQESINLISQIFECPELLLLLRKNLEITNSYVQGEILNLHCNVLFALLSYSQDPSPYLKHTQLLP
jgi:hypothetical protein